WINDSFTENNLYEIVRGVAGDLAEEYPPCYKDMSFWINDSFTENNLYEIVRGVAGDLAEEVYFLFRLEHDSLELDNLDYLENYFPD
nr:phenylalanine--tRNA ligase, chloroplastic/mitochondrial [Tanacetum cinerariifolium]